MKKRDRGDSKSLLLSIEEPYSDEHSSSSSDIYESTSVYPSNRPLLSERNKYNKFSFFEKFIERLFRCPCIPSFLLFRSNQSRIKMPNLNERIIDIQLDPKNQNHKYCGNVVCNQKYSIIFFIPQVLYEQFKFFFNFYFLLVALSQFIKPLQIGFLFTYIAPLAFVLSVTMLKEAHDDFMRYRRDCEVNNELFQQVTPHGIKKIRAANIMVGHIIQIKTNQRIPADMILLRTTDQSGSCFIRTDQLDGETDWKLRRAVVTTQKLVSDSDIFSQEHSITAPGPQKSIHSFEGVYNIETPEGRHTEPLELEQTLWANTVLASSIITGIVIYTGKDTRSAMNTKSVGSKVGKTDLELNMISKLLFIQSLILAGILVYLKGLEGSWELYLFRFLLLFSSIIPISMRVNLDLAKSFYSYNIEHDKQIFGTVVRNSSLPEELARVSFLFTDKTGTLTQNQMLMKKLQLSIGHFSPENFSDLSKLLELSYSPSSSTIISSSSTTSNNNNNNNATSSIVSEVLEVSEQQNNINNINNISPPNSPKSFLNSNQQHAPTIRSALEVIALCHNVTPVFSKETNEISFQAASPDEIALTEFAMSVGLKLNKRDAHCIELINPFGKTETYEILNDFPFTSQRKRMGIILRCNKTNEITFFCKGADIVMNQIVQPNDWMSEECENLAREGLRTLVLARKSLTNEEYEIFLSKYIQAKSSLNDRSIKVEEVVGMLEIDMELIAVTGVEDKLQNDVRTTLETLKNACIRVWMLTGDKIETAKCVALSSGLVMKMQDILTLTIDSPNEVSKLINKLRFRSDCALVIDGDSLKWCLNSSRRQEFLELSTQCPSVIVCRCSPTQKAEIVISVREFTKNRVCSIGDGGNDVSMIQVADVGIGVVGKEGKQASLAADFSINEFSHLKRLMLWHGRNSYKSTARLSQFVIHRGLTISVMQAVFSAIFYYAPIPLFTGWLMVGYATVYTMLPVFSLVLDKDVTDEAVFIYPELYHDIQKGKSLSLLTFTLWQMRSVYQGGIIIILTIYLFERQFAHIVTIAFTSLIMIELLNVAVEIRKWHPFHVWSLLVTVIIYVSSLFFLGGYFNTQILLSSLSSLLLIVFFTMGPIILIKFVRFRLFPPSSSKLS